MNSNQEEQQYLDILKDILDNGIDCDDRTGTGTKSVFGCMMKFNLEEHFPLLTTKKMFTRGIVEELLFFLNGRTNTKLLEEKCVNIWKGNTSREFLDKLGMFDRNEGDSGESYGFNFRHYGAKYVDCNTDYTGQGFDQIQNVLDLIKNEPCSRRILINLWNPLTLNNTLIPVCHVVYQFKITGNKLNCFLFQRSADIFLGVGFNLASASLLTHILAKLSNLEVGTFVHSISDCHLYNNHIEQAKEQISRTPYQFPKLKIIDRGQTKVEDFITEDFVFEDYKFYPSIKGEMAI